MKSATLSQCWFCNAINLVVPGDAEALCVACGIGARAVAALATPEAAPLLQAGLSVPDGSGAITPFASVVVPDVAEQLAPELVLVHPPLNPVTKRTAPSQKVEADVDSSKPTAAPPMT